MSLETLFSSHPEQLDALLDGLVEQGYFILPNVFDAALCTALLSEVEHYEDEGDLKPAGIGRGEAHQLASEIRRDQIKWLDGNTQAQIFYLQQMAHLQYQLNRALFLGLFEYECHFALYKKGDFYKKHLDSFRGAANRMITTVLYLNPNWQADWGGELVIYPEEGEGALLSVQPEMGKLAIFMSEQMPHEVLPTLYPRVSIAGWFRLNNNQAGIIDPAL